MTLLIEGKADRTAKGYKFICPIFLLDKTFSVLITITEVKLQMFGGETCHVHVRK